MVLGFWMTLAFATLHCHCVSHVKSDRAANTIIVRRTEQRRGQPTTTSPQPTTTEHARSKSRSKGEETNTAKTKSRSDGEATDGSYVPQHLTVAASNLFWMPTEERLPSYVSEIRCNCDERARQGPIRGKRRGAKLMPRGKPPIRATLRARKDTRAWGQFTKCLKIRRRY